MKKAFVITLIAGFALVTQAGGVQWGQGDATEECLSNTDVIADVPRDVQASMMYLTSPGRASAFMGTLYNASFAPLVNGILDTAESLAFSSEPEDLDAARQAAAYAAFAAMQQNPEAAKLLTPADFNATENIVPEPSSVTLLALGGMAMLLRRKYRHPQR